MAFFSSLFTFYLYQYKLESVDFFVWDVSWISRLYYMGGVEGMSYSDTDGMPDRHVWRQQNRGLQSTEELLQSGALP